MGIENLVFWTNSNGIIGVLRKKLGCMGTDLETHPGTSGGAGGDPNLVEALLVFPKTFRSREEWLPTVKWGALRVLCVFHRYSHAIEDCTHHTTHLSARDSIVSSNVIKGARASEAEEIVGALAHPNAPLAVYGSVTPGTHRHVTVSSI